VTFCIVNFLGNNDDNNWQAPNRSREDLIARECHWGELAHTTRRLLIGEVAECLSVCCLLLLNRVFTTFHYMFFDFGIKLFSLCRIFQCCLWIK